MPCEKGIEWAFGTSLYIHRLVQHSEGHTYGCYENGHLFKKVHLNVHCVGTYTMFVLYLILRMQLTELHT